MRPLLASGLHSASDRFIYRQNDSFACEAVVFQSLAISFFGMEIPSTVDGFHGILEIHRIGQSNRNHVTAV